MPTIRHTLALEIPDTPCDTILRVWDASVYGQGLVVDCPRLDITLPGFSSPIFITTLTEGFMQTFNAKDLELQNEADEVPMSLPDGLYKIRYSVSPNEQVFVEYYHLRTTKVMNLYYRELCKVQLEPCEPGPEQHQKLHDLRYIKMYIDAAKAKTEYCHAPNEGVQLLAYAEKLLQKYLTGTCVSCPSGQVHYHVGFGPVHGH